jgi:tripartite-type tricarboxylate transporter receptor subunit TctC
MELIGFHEPPVLAFVDKFPGRGGVMRSFWGRAERRLFLQALFIGVTLTNLGGFVRADSVADFYKGKTITMIVGGSAGGGYDTLGRAISQFIGKHIPGNPTIVVQDMPGAGGIIAMNYLYSKADKDGSVIALVENNPPLEPLFGTEEARYDATKFNWLGTPSVEVGLTLVWHTVPVNSMEDLKVRATTMGGSGTQSTQAFDARLFNAVLGTKMQIVNGYQGLNDIFLAMERGEIDGFPSVFYSAVTSTRPNWLPQHLAKAVLQFGPQKLKELPDVPYAEDLVSNPDDKQLMDAALASQALGRPLVMPPDVPKERVAAIREALAETFADPDFDQVSKKIGLIVNAPQTGQQLQDVIERAYATPSPVIDRLRKLAHP